MAEINSSATGDGQAVDFAADFTGNGGTAVDLSGSGGGASDLQTGRVNALTIVNNDATNPVDVELDDCGKHFRLAAGGSYPLLGWDTSAPIRLLTVGGNQVACTLIASW